MLISRFTALLFLLSSLLLLGCSNEKKEAEGNSELPTVTMDDESAPEEDYWWKGKEFISDTLEMTNWKKYEVERNDSLIQRFIQEKRRTFDHYLEGETEYYKLKDLPKFLYTIRFNNDSLTDIIYQGSSGAEGDIFRVYLNRADTFQLAFEKFQYTKNVKVKNGLISSLTVADPGCCAEIIHNDYDFKITHTGPEVNFRQIRKMGRHQNTERPVSPLNQPKPFKLPDNPVLIRATCAEVNGPYNGVSEQLGNIVATYSANIQGKILASQKDKDGKEWHFVELPFRKSQPDSSVFYFDSNYIQGWVPANDLTTKN